MKTIHTNTDEKLTSGSHFSYWTENVKASRQLQPLNKNISTDVVIVGGGIAGLSVAYCLLKAGKNIVLVEDGYIGSGETGRTTGHLVTALDDRYYNLQRMFGVSGIRLIAESHGAAIDFIENVCRQENIKCDFQWVDGFLFQHMSDDSNNIHRELEAAANAGLNVTEIGQAPGLKNYNGRCIRFPKQAQFHPMKYLLGLYKSVERMGGQIYTGTHAEEISYKGIVTDSGFRVNAHQVVIATNTPVNNKYVMHLKQLPYRTYVIGALIPKSSIEHALWWDTGDFTVIPKTPPYHYVRVQSFNNAYDVLISGGEDHPTGLADTEEIAEENRYAKLEEWTRHHFPIKEILYRWSGQVMEPMDSLAFIGRNPWDRENVFIVTGDSGNGLTHSTIAGMLITDLINGKENKWGKIYSPSRVKWMKTSRAFFNEFVGGLIAYLRENPNDSDSVSLASIPRGEARIVELRKEKYGAYRDQNGQLHLVSAVCTHLGCIVKWNNDEKSWDCPCHGSRFTYDGKLMNGPANVELHSFTETEVEAPIHS